jgi:lipopolysaccharide/colanic/teichoic acid biosynthesis glycosyltransferase
MRGSRGIPRLVEATVALAGLVVGSPLLLLIAVLVRVTSRGPVLFRQQRVGRHGVPFTLFKFRTMRADNVGPQVTATGDPRVTAVGRLLRKAKLDELPELFNVVRGDMSLVGPRPEVPRYVDLGDPRWQAVLAVCPGITDPVTLRLRNEEELIAGIPGDRETCYREVIQPFKLRGYADYLASRTVWSDLRVLVDTVLAVALPGRVPAPTLAEVEASSTSGDRRT